VSVLIRKITLTALAAALAGGTLALPAASSAGPVAHASKCKKKHKRAAQSAKKKKKCKRSGGQGGGAALPGQATHPNATPPTQRTVSDVTVASNPVLAGDSTTGQVTISGPAPSGGQTVTLESADSSVASAPPSVVVPAAQTVASFPVSTGTAGTTSLTASIGTSSDNTPLRVVSEPSVISVSLERHCLVTADSFAANRVTLDVATPSDATVLLSSDAPLSLAPTTASTTVPAGSKTALFGVLAGTPNPAVTVTATLGASTATDTALVSASAQSPAVTGVSLQPNSVTTGGSSVGTVTLDCEAPSGGTVVNLLSAQPAVANPTQANVTVPAGQRSATFSVGTSGVGTAHISADTGTGGPQEATIQVTGLPQ
jgi:hypothetical protein